jgi:hypothetical protein
VKKSLVFIFCTLFIFSSIQMSLAEELDEVPVSGGIVADEPVDKAPSVEIIKEEVAEKEPEESKIEVVEKDNRVVEQDIQPKEQPQQQENVRGSTQREAPRRENVRENVQRRENVQNREANVPLSNRNERQDRAADGFNQKVLLKIADSNFKYSRIPGIKVSDVSSSKNVALFETETSRASNVETVNETVEKRTLNPEVLAKTGLLLFVVAVIGIYKLRLPRKKGLIKRKRKKFKF